MKPKTSFLMTCTLTCPECESAIAIYPEKAAGKAQCDICETIVDVHFDDNHEQGILKDCPSCGRKDFYKQKDFNRKVGVILFVVAALFSLFLTMTSLPAWTYFSPLIGLWLVDFFLFQKLPPVVICYKCQAIFRGVSNINEIADFNHEMNDRIVYSDHDFQGKTLDH